MEQAQKLRQLSTKIALFLVLMIFGISIAQQNFQVIGTGSVVGLYYPVGGAVSFAVNNENPNLLLTVKVTPGSISNIEALNKHEIDLALAQSDVFFQAVSGERAFRNTPLHDLRVLMGLHAEPLHLICREDAEVEAIRDIVGKRINLGNIGSGRLNTTRAVLNAFGINETEDLRASYAFADEASELLIEGLLDCYFFTVGIGSTAIKVTAALESINLIPLDGEELESLSGAAPYYSFVTIPAGTYQGVDEDIRTFGVRAYLISHKDLHADTAYQIVKTLIEELEPFKASYPALESLTTDNLIGNFADFLHEGARWAYIEAGLLNE